MDIYRYIDKDHNNIYHFTNFDSYKSTINPYIPAAFQPRIWGEAKPYIKPQAGKGPGFPLSFRSPNVAVWKSHMNGKTVGKPSETLPKFLLNMAF